MPHLKPGSHFSKTVKGNLGVFKTLKKADEEFGFVEGAIWMEIFFFDRKLAAEPIEHCMHCLVSPGSPTVLVLALELCVVFSGQEARLVKKRNDLVFDRDDMRLFLVLHSIIALAIVTEENRQPVSHH
jgi:hypothetical protein